MRKFLVIGVIALAVVVLLGLALYNGGPNNAVSKTDEATVQNAEDQAKEACVDNCDDCPEKVEGECSGHDVDAVGHEDVKCEDHDTVHEKGSKECEELKAAGKCPHKCPGHSAK